MPTPAEIENATKGLTPEQVKWLGGADPTDPYIRMRGGLPALDAKKPDGTAVSAIAQPTNINPGSIVVKSQDLLKLNVNGATDTKATSKLTPGETKRRGFNNPLDMFASYTTVFTFACLNKEEVNNPYLYRNGKFVKNQVVFSSAGRYDKERVPTAYGTPEYFIDNLEITSALAPTPATGPSTATNISFDIYEPYSCGLFLQSLATVATVSGYANYLDGTPYVLKMEFLGYTEDGKQYTATQPKFFVMTLRKCNFSFNEGGSNYKVEAVPYNHAGFSSLINTTYNDISLVGSTVQELLSTGSRSLQSVLNEREESQVKNGLKLYPNIYEIHFPKTSYEPIPGVEPSVGGDKATVNASNTAVNAKTVANRNNSTAFTKNIIGDSSFGFKADSGGNYVAPRAADVVDQNSGKIVRDQITIDPKTRTFQYSQGQTLTGIISQSIMASQYAVDAIKKDPDINGRIDWFRVDVQIQLLDYDTKVGDYSKRYIYRVMPYKVHSSVFSNPNAIPDGYDQLEKEIVKQYDYMYTGQNNDIIKFDIELNMAFYTAITPASPQDAGKASNDDTQSAGTQERSQVKTEEGAAGPQAQVSKIGGAKVRQDPAAIKLPFGGSGSLTPEQIVANNFHTAFLQNGQANLVNVSIDIMGDPYWLTDNGTGGYIPGPGASEMITEDGAANYEGGDIYVYIRFRTPVEPKEVAGDYLFVDQKDSPFSGIYKVITCLSHFKGGQFTQSLTAARMPLQASDFDEKPVISKQKTKMFNTDDVAKPASDIFYG